MQFQCITPVPNGATEYTYAQRHVRCSAPADPRIPRSPPGSDRPETRGLVRSGYEACQHRVVAGAHEVVVDALAVFQHRALSVHAPKNGTSPRNKASRSAARIGQLAGDLIRNQERACEQFEIEAAINAIRQGGQSHGEPRKHTVKMGRSETENARTDRERSSAGHLLRGDQ